MSFEECVEYIRNHWEQLTVFCPEDHDVHIGLPHHFIVPNHDVFEEDQFYWDTFFIALGLLTEEKHIHLVKGMIGNFRHLQSKYGIIPARNKFYNLGISQPPFLSTLVRKVYEQTHDKVWLEEVVAVLVHELETYWNNENGAEHHRLDMGLSRYCDHTVTHSSAEHESGWDMTSRFYEKCLDFAPIDLNSLLYKYEVDLAYFYGELGNDENKQEYKEKAKKRAELVIQYCYHHDRGFFFDYNHVAKEQSPFLSLAGFFPLWAGLATPEQAQRVRDHLHDFEHKGGLSTTPKLHVKRFKQWDYPNGWPCLQYIAIMGLKRYGFDEDAKRLAEKWLQLNEKIFLETGKFWEKYDVVHAQIGKSGRYETQSGFGWTNGAFLALHKEFFE